MMTLEEWLYMQSAAVRAGLRGEVTKYQCERLWEASYNAGVLAERERCAGIADEYHQRDPVHFIANAIAAAIRRGE